MFVCSGEVSGDIGGAHLVRQMRGDYRDVTFFGVGGPRMRAAGAEVDDLTNHLGTVGVTEVFSHAVPLIALAWRIRKLIRVTRPHAAILIGNDLFNAMLSRWLRRQGIATIAYFPPQVWIWGAVLRFMARGFDVVLAAFPEEQEAYARVLHAGRSVFVGHYLAGVLEPVSAASRARARGELGLPDGSRVVALMAGSRLHEVRRLAPVLLGAARQLLAKDPAIRFVLPLAEPQLGPIIERIVGECGLDASVSIIPDSQQAMTASDLVLLSSGTSTLEAALLGIPSVVAYRVSAVTYLVIRACLRLGLLRPVPISLPNLLLGRAVVPEVLQQRATADEVAREAWDLLTDSSRVQRMRTELADARACIGAPDALQRAGRIIYDVAAGERDRRTAGAHHQPPVRNDGTVSDAGDRRGAA